MTKKIFLMTAWLGISTFLFNSCTQEFMHEHEAHNAHKAQLLTSKIISLSKSKHKDNVSAELKNSNEILSKITTKKNGKVVSYGSVYIDTDKVTYIEKAGGYHTYTFAIQRTNPSPDDPVENLVLSSLPDGTYKEYLVSYNLTSSEKQNLLNGNFVNTTGKTTFTELTKGTYNGNNQLAKDSNCGWSSQTVWIPCSSGQHDGSNFQSCEFLSNNTNGVPPSAYTISVYNYCPETPTPTYSYYDSGDLNNNGGVFVINDGPYITEICVGSITNTNSSNTDLQSGCYFGVVTQPSMMSPLAFGYFLNTLPTVLQDVANNQNNYEFHNGLNNYFIANLGSQEAKNFITWALHFKQQNATVSWSQFQNEIINNKNYYENSSLTSIDEDNNTDGGFDTTTYTTFNPQQQNWPSISTVIPVSDFIGWGFPGVKRNCMDYAKAQIAKKGYQISNYGAIGQTIQIYREQTGANLSKVIDGLSYLKYALSNGIPVIVGIHHQAGHPGNADQSTDHFVVIVGMGSDSNGNYFRFFDNASGNSNLGASLDNKLYYNSSTGLISGTSVSPYANGHTYILTQIRKSKLK